MLRDSDVKRAVAEIAADPGARDRYPLLSQAETWPPQHRTRPVPGILTNPTREEERRFWDEVEHRASGRPLQEWAEPARAADTRDDEDRESYGVRFEPRILDDEVKALDRQVREAALKQGAERREAFAQSARTYQRLFEKVNGEMVRAGVIRQENVREWEAVSRAFRDEGFDQLVAEARAIEARRNDQRPLPTATRAQVEQVAKIERDQAAREGVEFPRRDAAPTLTAPIATPAPTFRTVERGEPLRDWPPAPGRFEHAEDQMLRDYKRELRPGQADPYAHLDQPARPTPEQPRAPVREDPGRRAPPDPYAMLEQAPPARPATPEREERPRPAAPDPYAFLDAPPLPQRQEPDREDERDQTRRQVWDRW